ncbi:MULTISPECIES: YidC/Oxa1 family membrane protein insertase [Thermoanaerobacterium]|uniref:Membrane protein insertase, YidC/Oxa1 family n=1 Tax=Thermoanaerobacterium xylanolyticum (strain ATCC 49914 / DSM 7097 / LX-11) TaxID=858215 RepID=F6BG90_THEXL|nr:YidC/Oxa1 family membrane protein insertase [Thermoanaerobacterium xylanolyticum]AEF18406.1 membrane protein insertase, YidC/Oxa1 family [Thermoanaerobacterium xylanolyticum LX-11]
MASIGMYLGQLLKFIYDFVGNYGVAIIIFTILIRVILLPFYVQQMGTMRKMKEISPLVEEIKKKYAKDPQKMNEEMMKLYKEKNVNPMSGCLPMLLPLIILWPLFAMLRSYPAFSTASFLWLKSLAEKDPYFILPILSGVTTYISSAMIQTDNNQKSMNLIMSAFMIWITVSLPAGVGIYWVTSNIFQIVQQYIFLRPTEPMKGESSNEGNNKNRKDS